MTIRRTAGSEVTDLAVYSRAAQKSAARIIGVYSTSFGMATGLLGRRVRPGIQSVYGLVRVADEIVDGAAAQAGADLTARRALLDGLEAETAATLCTGYSTNLIVHSFALTAAAAGIGPELTGPFFASMRRDLDPAPFTADGVREYIYGSAEVIGLMCLNVFLHGLPGEPEQRSRLEAGARRLGSAFQRINFLRDLRTDWEGLHRNYFPGIDPEHLTEAQKLVLVADIDDDLAAAGAVIPELPPDCRAAVGAAHDLFTALTRRIRATPATQLLATRVRVPNPVKVRIALKAQTRYMVRRTR